MSELSETEITELVAAAPFRRFCYTLKQIAESGIAWGLFDNGWAMYRDANDRQLFPLWPFAEYAALCATGNHAAYAATPMDMDELINTLIPLLIDDEIPFVVFPTPGDTDSEVHDAAKFELDLLAELRKDEA